ncbi:LamG domain-containing protein [Streptomyces griseosporeus]|uniref:LamG domain-containing protein n=1 Tax=Streptomyces griseosporeus TaxID=1910 RepID=UPI001E4C3893|nr:LamG domain-containing protein [Streptomyces griseosporeus]
MAAGCAAVAFVAGTSGVAAAVDNLPPKQPLVGDLKTDSKACGTGDEKAYVGGAPRLSAALYDPVEDDRPGEVTMVKGEYEVWWTGPDGVEQRLTHTMPGMPSGFRQPWQVPDGIPANTVVSWHVRAFDGTAYSPWSSEGDGTVCEFVYDDEAPQKAAIDALDYPPDAWSVDGVGVYGHFTVNSPSDDVVAYDYNFIGGPYGTARPDRLGGSATISFLPDRTGPQTLTVMAVDRAGHRSAASRYEFFVRRGRAPVAHWTLADPAGSTSAGAETGTAARAGSGVTFGAQAPQGTALASTARLDGSSHGYLTPDAPAVADPRRTFAVGAWVRPAQTDRNMTVASQDAGQSASFALGLRARDGVPTWSFTVGGVQLTGGTPETGEWAHLLGVYDAETGRARLYVNGHQTGTEAQAAPAATAGAFQLGRVRDGQGYHDRWHGELGDVRVHDRVVVPGEATELSSRKPRLLGHWSLETAADGTSPELYGGTPLRLGPGATIHRGPDGSCIPDIDPDCPAIPYALVGDGHLTLDGESAYAATEGPVVDTSDSFTLGVVVRLADSEPAHPVTLLSQAGEHTDAFKVRYEPSAHAWQLVMPQRDEQGAPGSVVAQTAMADDGEGQGHRIAVVYDDATDKITLYLDGHATIGSTADLPDGWRSSGPLQVGRGHTGDGWWGEYLHGDVDEVQAFSGVLGEHDISQLGWGTEPCLCWYG